MKLYLFILHFVMMVMWVKNVKASPTVTSPAPPAQICRTLTSCESCLKNVSCLWCYINDSCSDYPVSHLLPPSSVCPLAQARWGVCWVNFEALIIAMAVVSGVLLLGVAVCCCCCCRCCGSSGRYERVEDEVTRQRERNRQLSDGRRAERRMKHDEIRKKYGLMSDSDHPYSRFENE